MTKPTDPAGEKFDEAVAEAFDRDCMREGTPRDKEHEHNVAQAAIRTAADTMAAERVAARKKLELEEQHDSLWVVHRIFFRTSDVCIYCAGDASSRKHDQLMDMIALRVAELTALEAKEEK